MPSPALLYGGALTRCTVLLIMSFDPERRPIMSAHPYTIQSSCRKLTSHQEVSRIHNDSTFHWRRRQEGARIVRILNFQSSRAVLEQERDAAEVRVRSDSFDFVVLDLFDRNALDRTSITPVRLMRSQ